MTVADLKQILDNFNDDTPIYVYDYCNFRYDDLLHADISVDDDAIYIC